MRNWAYKRDEAGNPRRFFSHGEATWWAAMRVGKFAGVVVGISLLRAVYGYFVGDRDAAFFVLAGMISLGLWVIVAGAIFSYIALSGGVVSRAARVRQRRPEA